MPVHGDVFFDARDGNRSCRVSWHSALGVFVISVWRGDVCTGTFQLPRADVPAFVGAFVSQLADEGHTAERAAG